MFARSQPALRLLALLSLIAGFITLLQPQPASAQQPRTTKTSAPDGAIAAPNSERELLRQAAAISAQVGKIRGLALREEIDKGIKNRDQLRQILLERLAEEVSNEEIENEAKVYKKLGLLPADLDYKDALLNILTEQIAGFYDQHAKELYIMEGIPLDLQRPAMAHEIFHAIQDQHFDIKRMVEPINNLDNGDFALARSALIEGDASLVMIDFSLYERNVLPRGEIRSVVDIPMMAGVLEQLTRQDIGALQQLMPEMASGEGGSVDPNQLADTALAEAPGMVRKLLVFPYFAGMRFIIHARLDHDWKRVNQIYENPPVSTEQILHPERYFAGDDPVLLDFKAGSMPQAGPLIYQSVLGEYQMRLILEEHLLEGDKPVAEASVVDEALRGWGGDLIRAYESGDGRVLITHLSVWDTLSDAGQYFDALVTMMQTRYPDATLSHSEGKYGRSVCIVDGQGAAAERIYVEQWGDLVLHLEGLPTEIDAQGHETNPFTSMLRDQIMGSVTRTPFQKTYREKLDAYDAARAASTSTAGEPASGRETSGAAPN